MQWKSLGMQLEIDWNEIGKRIKLKFGMKLESNWNAIGMQLERNWKRWEWNWYVTGN